MKTEIQNQVKWLNVPLFRIGETAVTLGGIGAAFLIIMLTLVLSKIVQRIMFKQLSKKEKISKSVIYAMNRIINYFFIVVGILIASESMGLKLSSLAIIFGFLSVGIGFGLQNLTSNFISGVILLVERPIGVGDLVTLNDRTAEVMSINMRSTTVRTFDHLTIIVPNSKFIEGEVTNWTVGDPRIRIHCPVGVAYGSDEKKVRNVLIEVAHANGMVLKQPKPVVRFLEFGDSSLNFDLLVWTGDPENQKNLRSEINFSIAEAFRENEITIPFPQRDVHLYPSPSLEKLVGQKGGNDIART